MLKGTATTAWAENILTMVKKIFGAIALGLGSFALACPNPQIVQQDIKKIFRAPLKVVEVRPAPIKGLCEAVVALGGQKYILYTDESGKYILLGSRPFVNIFDLKSLENITRKELEELNKLSPEQVKELEKYVVFTYGTKGKTVYLFTDPECPFCHRLEPTLKKLADEGKIKVKVILFPLWFHPHAKEKAVAMVCQKIGWEGLFNKYWTPERMKKLKEWQCERGKEFIEKSIQLGNKIGVSGTPTMITESGKKVVGALPEAQLKKELGLEDNGTK
ncbi:MAG TPA: DsbC family protein [Aquifex sp.]|nr:DsbC family protein [Aquifex sp.]